MKNQIFFCQIPRFTKTAVLLGLVTLGLHNSCFAAIPMLGSLDATSVASNLIGVPSSAAPSGIVGSIAPMIKNVMPSVVNILVRHVDMVRRYEQLGSGVIVDAAHGYILTNAHVVKDGQSITVTLSDSRRLSAKIIGYDLPSDIAVLQIDVKRLSQIPLGDSDNLSVGDFVVAIGSPFGLRQTVTSGVVSGLERNNLGIEGYENFIQTDAPINPGNSGGALINMKGELIGINTAIITSSPKGGSVGVGLAVPSNMAKSVTEQLIKYGNIARGVLGITVQNVTPSLVLALHLPSVDGALVTEVLPGTPAKLAGIQSKDFIVAVADKPVHSAGQFRNRLSLMRVGSTVALKILRNGSAIVVSGTLVDPEKINAARQKADNSLLAGMELDNFNQLIDNERVVGIEILNMASNSAAYVSGLHPGDVILSVNGKAIANLDELRQAVILSNAGNLLLEIKRGMFGNMFLVLER